MSSLLDWMCEIGEKWGFSSDAEEASSSSSGGSAGRAGTPIDYTGARIVIGSGGYVYAHFPDGEVVIQEGPEGQKDLRLKRGTKAYEAILREIDPCLPGGHSEDDGTGEPRDEEEAETSIDYSRARRIVRGSGGYVYALFDGMFHRHELVIQKGPEGQKDLPVKRGTKAFEAIMREIDGQYCVEVPDTPLPAPFVPPGPVVQGDNIPPPGHVTT